jgi:hypothetical protein
LGTKERRCEELVRVWDLDPRARQVEDGPGFDDEFRLEAEHLSVEVVRLVHVRHRDTDVVDSLHVNHATRTSCVRNEKKSTLYPQSRGRRVGEVRRLDRVEIYEG